MDSHHLDHHGDVYHGDTVTADKATYRAFALFVFDPQLLASALGEDKDEEDEDKDNEVEHKKKAAKVEYVS